MKLQTHDLSYFLGKTVCVYDGSQNMFVYQPMRKKDKGTVYVLTWESKGVYTSKLGHYILLSYIA